MRAAARNLRCEPPTDLDAAHEVHFLSGERFWHQTVFCFYSLIRQSALAYRPVVIDDGTIRPDIADTFRAVMPHVRIVGWKEVESRLEEVLPRDRFAYLRDRRVVYPNLRKLTDVHAGGAGFRLVLDSDMLFFRRPTVLEQWIQNPHGGIHMIDVEESYGYSRETLGEVCGHRVPEQLNVGICGLPSGSVDFEALQSWAERLIGVGGPSYYEEQALTAMLMGGMERTVAGAGDYICMPSMEEARQPTAVMHHYVAGSKEAYFEQGWRQALARAEAATAESG